VDFPSLREGREVYLCWQLGEERVAFWHELNVGFAGRQPCSLPMAAAVTRPLRIAHGYGNSRRHLALALEGPVDYIEADVWYQGGRVAVRHERKLGHCPSSSTRRTKATPGTGPVVTGCPWADGTSSSRSAPGIWRTCWPWPAAGAASWWT